jgi:RNase P subunit RPR2
MRATVHCEECGERMRLERIILEPERLRLICHQCEAPLKVEITAEDLSRPVKNPLAIYSR